MANADSCSEQAQWSSQGAQGHRPFFPRDPCLFNSLPITFLFAAVFFFWILEDKGFSWTAGQDPLKATASIN